MNKKMIWSIVNFLIIIGYTLVSMFSGITICLLIIHFFTNVSPVDAGLVPILFAGSFGISFFAAFKIWKFINWFYFDTKAKLIWLNNLPMREKIIDIRTIEPLNPDDDWMNKKKGRKL